MLTNMPKDDNRKLSLFDQSAMILFAKCVGFVLSLLLPLLVVRFLTQEDVGVYRQLFLVITNAATVLPLGFSMSAYYFLNREREGRDRAIVNILLFNFAVGGLACLTLTCYPQLLGNLFQNEQITSLAPLVGLIIWLWIFSSFLEVVALANQEARVATVFIILAQLSKAFLMVAAVVWFESVEAIIFAAIVQGIGQTVILFVYLHSRFPRWWSSFDVGRFREHFLYALPYGIVGLLYTAQTDIHNYFVASRFSAEQFAVYAYGCFQLPLIWAMYESISAVLLSRMSELQARCEKREMLLISVRGMEKLAFAYFPIFVFLMIVAGEFITTLFTQKFAASVPIFRVNLLVLPLYCLVLDPLERSFKELGFYLTKVRIFILVALVIFLSYGIKHFELTGMIAVVVAAFLCERAIMLWKILKILGARRSDLALLNGVFRIAAATVVAGSVLLLLYWIAKDDVLAACIVLSRRLLEILGTQAGSEFAGGILFLGICGTLFATIYLIMAVRFGAVASEDKDRLISIVNKLKRGFRAFKMRLVTSH